MIEVTLRRDKKGTCDGFLVRGHAGYGAYGKDIVCAAVSALVINTVNSIDALTEDTFRLEEDEEKGLLRLDMDPPFGERSALLLDSLALGLQGIQRGYGSQYIKISFSHRLR